MKRTSALIALLAVLVQSTAALAVTDTDYRIEFATLQGDHVQMLISESTVRTHCFWGRHSCSEKDLHASLYRAQIPADQGWISLRELRKTWQKVRDAEQVDSFRGYEISGDALVMLDGEDVAACPTAGRMASCNAPAAVRAVQDLQGRASYQQFLRNIERELRGPGHGATLLGPVGARYIVAMTQYGEGAQPQIARIYDVQQASDAPVQLTQLPANVSASMLDVTTDGDDLLFLVKLLRYAPGTLTKEYEQNIIYSVRQQHWVEIAPFTYPPADHLLWDATNTRFIEVDWNHQREGIELTRRGYQLRRQ